MQCATPEHINNYKEPPNQQSTDEDEQFGLVRTFQSFAYTPPALLNLVYNACGVNAFGHLI